MYFDTRCDGKTIKSLSINHDAVLIEFTDGSSAEVVVSPDSVRGIGLWCSPPPTIKEERR